MAGLSTAEAIVAAEAFAGITTYPARSLRIALFTVAPTDAGGGTEVSGGSYARQSSTWTVSAAAELTNSAEIAFTKATANWGTISWAGLYDNSTGDFLGWGPLDDSYTINSGDTFKFASGEFKIRFNPN